jgi:group I intron endonuclease
MQGIYKITNPEGKSYIGLSTNIETRWESYRYYTGMSKNSSIKFSLKKYGYDAHKFEILEKVKGDAKHLRDRERYWIDKYNTLNEGLNDNRGGCGTLNIPLNLNA